MGGEGARGNWEGAGRVHGVIGRMQGATGRDGEGAWGNCESAGGTGGMQGVTGREGLDAGGNWEDAQLSQEGAWGNGAGAAGHSEDGERLPGSKGDREGARWPRAEARGARGAAAAGAGGAERGGGGAGTGPGRAGAAEHGAGARHAGARGAGQGGGQRGRAARRRPARRPRLQPGGGRPQVGAPCPDPLPAAHHPAEFRQRVSSRGGRAEKAALETGLFEAQEELGQLRARGQQLEAEGRALRVAKEGLQGEWGARHPIQPWSRRFPAWFWGGSLGHIT